MYAEAAVGSQQSSDKNFHNVSVPNKESMFSKTQEVMSHNSQELIIGKSMETGKETDNFGVRVAVPTINSNSQTGTTLDVHV